jgi:photosynthetic reaction center cytochrome c subunit
VNRISRIVCWVVVCVGIVGAPFSNAQNATGASTSANVSSGKTAEQVYKNLQVLKGIPYDQLIPAMEFITASLGVECGFCHVERRFDQDDKEPKQTARKMMQMMLAINQGNFGNRQKVTCNTCHRGSRLPVSTPAVREAQPMLPATNAEDEKPLPNLPSPDELISKYVQAEGGANAIQKIATRVESGTAAFFGRQVDVEIFDKGPDKRVSIMHLPDGDSVTGIDGNEGWLANPHRPVLAMSRSETEGARMDADLQLPLHLKRIFRDLRPAPPEKIDAHDSYQVVALVAGETRARLFFDQQSGLLVRIIRYADTPLGPNPSQIDYGDYRPVDGVQVPFRWTTSRPAGQFTIQLTDVKQNVAIDDAKFAKPPQASN